MYQTTRRGEGEAHPSPTRSVASTLPGQSRYRKALLMAYEGAGMGYGYRTAYSTQYIGIVEGWRRGARAEAVAPAPPALGPVPARHHQSNAANSSTTQHTTEKCNYFGGGKSDMITVVVPGDRMKRLPQESIPERKRRQRERQQRDVIKQDRCDEVLVWLVWVGTEEKGEGEGGGGRPEPSLDAIAGP